MLGSQRRRGVGTGQHRESRRRGRRSARADRTDQLRAGSQGIEIAAGQEFTCAKLDDNSVKCWGVNTSGQLGQGNTTTLGVTAGQVAAAPAIALGTGQSVEQLTLAHIHACALLRDSAGASHMKCWGDNRWGQLGKGDKTNRGDDAGEMGDSLTDINLGAGRTAVSLAANGGHTCAILDNASVECWGLNTWGQIGRLNGNDTPPDPLVCAPGIRVNDCVGDDVSEVGALTAAIPGNVARLAVGYRHNCVLWSERPGEVLGFERAGRRRASKTSPAPRRSSATRRMRLLHWP